MTFVMDALQDRPMALFQMDDTTPLQDYSGYDRAGSTSGGTPAQHASLVKGAAWAPVLTSAITASTTNLVFKQGYEKEEFTLGAWVRVVNPSGSSAQQILGNSGQLDGLTINGNVVSFTTKYASNGTATASFDLQQERAVSVFGVHTENKNSLYVNGELVSEVVITEAQQADTYATTSSNLITGTTSGSQNIAVNALAQYAKALTAEEIKRQHIAGRNLPDVSDVVEANAGDVIPVSASNSNLFLDQWFSTADEWNSGQLSNVGVVEDRLQPQFAGSVSLAGQWRSQFNIDATGATSIYGVNLNWDGEGATVQVSLDGTSWETVTRGVNVTTIPAGFNPTDKVLQVRITFPGGILNDTSFVDNLNIMGFKTGVSPKVAGRTVTLTGGYPEREHQVTEYHDNWGAEIASGGTLVVSADADGATVARTIEIWIKRTGANPTFSATGTYYQNGAVSTNTLVSDSWTLFHIVAGADIPGTITINGPAQVGHIAIYDTALSAGTIASLYSAYVGTNATRVNDASIISMTEVANASQIYTHDWSIQGAG